MKKEKLIFLYQFRTFMRLCNILKMGRKGIYVQPGENYENHGENMTIH